MERLNKITNAKGKCGIYAIRNDIDGKLYIGSAINMYRRLNLHRSTLRSNCHHNIHLQRAWNRDTEENFSFCIVEEADAGDLLIREQYWLDEYECFATGYNLTPYAASPRGYKYTEEAIEKIRCWQVGRAKSAVQKQTMRESRIKLPGRGKSKYKGLSYVPKKNLWEVRIMAQKGQRAIYLGSFKDEKEAAMNYDYHAIRFYGRGNCFLNFPEKDYTNFEPKKIYAPVGICT